MKTRLVQEQILEGHQHLYYTILTLLSAKLLSVTCLLSNLKSNLKKGLLFQKQIQACQPTTCKLENVINVIILAKTFLRVIQFPHKGILIVVVFSFQGTHICSLRKMT